MNGIMLLALALVLIPGAAVHRIRPQPPDRSSPPVSPRADPLAVPSSLDVLAACLSAGMATSAAAILVPPGLRIFIWISLARSCG